MMQIEWISIKDLKPAEYNPRLLTDKEESDLKQSMERFGFIDPMIVNSNPDRKNTIIAGHQRMKVWAKLGHDSAPVIYIDLSSEKERELNIRHNRNTGEWDHTILKSFFQESDLLDWGFDKEDLQFQLQQLADPFEDDYVIPDKIETDIVLGDLFEIGDHRLLCGDSTLIDDVEKLMNGEKADMCFTDPPYGVCYSSKNEFLNALNKGNFNQKPIENDHMSLEDTSNFIYESFVKLKLSLSKRSSYYITAPQGGELMMMMMMMMQKADIPLRHCLIWAKNNHVLGRTDYNYKHEPILYGWCEVHDFYGNGKHRFSTWEIDKPLKNDLHPTMKPIELVSNALLNSTLENNIVIDLFLGSGTTMVAAHQLKRKCFGMEIDPKYCQVILNRILKLDPALTIFRNGEPYRPE